jgi:hypothetical protein
MTSFNDLVKSQIATVSVIPAKAGIQLLKTFWTPASAGVTIGGTFYEFINFRHFLFRLQVVLELKHPSPNSG